MRVRACQLSALRSTKPKPGESCHDTQESTATPVTSQHTIRKKCICVMVSEFFLMPIQLHQLSYNCYSSKILKLYRLKFILQKMETTLFGQVTLEVKTSGNVLWQFTRCVVQAPHEGCKQCHPKKEGLGRICLRDWHKIKFNTTSAVKCSTAVTNTQTHNPTLSSEAQAGPGPRVHIFEALDWKLGRHQWQPSWTQRQGREGLGHGWATCVSI